MPRTSNAVREPRRFSGEQLLAARVAAGVTRTELAATVGRGADAVRHYENGRAVPPADILSAMAHALRIDIDDLYAPSAVSA